MWVVKYLKDFAMTGIMRHNQKAVSLILLVSGFSGRFATSIIKITYQADLKDTRKNVGKRITTSTNLTTLATSTTLTTVCDLSLMQFELCCNFELCAFFW